MLIGGAASVAAARRWPRRPPPRPSAPRPPGARARCRRGTVPPGPRASTAARACTRWAADTWRSLVAMTDPKTGLPADNITESLAAGDRSGYTSPTNIGGYLWSDRRRPRPRHHHAAASARARLIQTLTTLLRMEHHEPSGMFYNWYDEATGEVLTTWPEDGDQRLPVPLQRRQRLARRRAARRADRRPRRRAAGRRGSSTGCAGTCSTTRTPPTPGCVRAA